MIKFSMPNYFGNQAETMQKPIQGGGRAIALADTNSSEEPEQSGAAVQFDRVSKRSLSTLSELALEQTGSEPGSRAASSKASDDGFVLTGNAVTLVAAKSHVQGSFAKLSRALIVGMQQPVAVKEIPKKTAGMPPPEDGLVATWPQHIKQEVQALRDVGSPLQPLFELEDDEGKSVHLVMPLMAGSAKDLRDATRPLPEQRMLARHILSQVAHELCVYGDRGYVHKDVKPANVLFDEDGNFHLGDCGSAEKIDPETHETAGTSVTTPEFAAPEKDGGLTPAFDVWCLGMMAMQLYTPVPNQVTKVPASTYMVLAIDGGGDPRDKLLGEYHAALQIFCRADPQLYQFVTQHMLRADPSDRAPIKQVAAFMQRLRHEADNDGQAWPKVHKTLSDFNERHNSADIEALRQEAKKLGL